MASLVQSPSSGDVAYPIAPRFHVDVPWLSAVLARPLRMLGQWRKRHRARQELLALDAHLLRDIGLTRGDAVREWQKGFWEA